MDTMPQTEHTTPEPTETTLTPEHADRFKDLVRRASTTPKSEFDKAEAERKKLEATGKK
jgi:hypothetical protein